MAGRAKKVAKKAASGSALGAVASLALSGKTHLKVQQLAIDVFVVIWKHIVRVVAAAHHQRAPAWEGCLQRGGCKPLNDDMCPRPAHAMVDSGSYNPALCSPWQAVQAPARPTKLTLLSSQRPCRLPAHLSKATKSQCSTTAVRLSMVTASWKSMKEHLQAGKPGGPRQQRHQQYGPSKW